MSSLLIVAGAVYVAVVISVTRIATRFAVRFVPGAREEFVYAYALASTAYQYVSWAMAGGQASDVTVEWAGFAVFGLLAVTGLRWPIALAAGWFLHVGWDYALHPMPQTAWVPAWFPDLCVGFDVPLAAYIAARARGYMPTAVRPRAVVTGLALVSLLAVATPVRAQEHAHHHGAPQADAQATQEPAAQPALTPFFSTILHHAGSGTSVDPPSSPLPMVGGRAGSWMWMLHGNVQAANIAENSPGVEGKVVSNNWLMPMVGKKVGPGLFTARAMVSLEPAGRFREELEPYEASHDLIMEAAATYDLLLSRNLLLSFYGGPVGEPALGASTFMHRLSASEDPLLPLSHAALDGAHQARDVLTTGLAYRQVRAEVSGFHGRGPDPDRVAVEQGAIDSWSSRVTVSPGRNWTMQASGGRVASPDAAVPDQDVRRITGSIAYTRSTVRGYWASTIGWGRTQPVGDRAAAYDSYLAESTFKSQGHIVWGRIEAAERFVATNIGGVHRHGAGTIRSYTGGYAREVRLAQFLETAVGGQVTSYETPALLAPAYGSRPVVFSVFVRVRPNGH
ncbi:MAG: hypothetical protein FJW14_03315 [Acidimicrobiia bacterium]|nr:hypothetical protein [Acidimicrobiia bacterium]